MDSQESDERISDWITFTGINRLKTGKNVAMVRVLYRTKSSFPKLVQWRFHGSHLFDARQQGVKSTYSAIVLHNDPVSDEDRAVDVDRL